MRIRDVLRKIVSTQRLQGRYNHDDVIKTLRSQYPDLVDAETSKLLKSALRKILADLELRQLRKLDPNQGQLPLDLIDLPGSFDAYAVGASNNRGERIGLGGMTIKMSRQASKKAPLAKKKKSSSEILRSLLEKYESYILNEDELLVDVIRRAHG